MESSDESASMVVSAVFNTREDDDSRSVLGNKTFWGVKLPHLSESVTSEIFKL